MRTFHFAALLALLSTLTGCAGVVSLHPLALPSDKDVVVDPALTGVWEEVKAEGQGAPARYSVTRSGSGYSVSVAAEEATFKGSFLVLRTGDHYLLDVYCPSDGPLVPAHLYLKLRFEKEDILVSELQTDWLKEQIKTRGQLRYESLEEDTGRTVITSSTADLRRLLLPYANDPRAFDDESRLRRVK